MTTETTASRHLPFGDRQEGRFYGKDIISVKQFDHADLDYIFEVARDAADGGPRRHLRPSEGQVAGQRLLRALDPDLVVVHCSHGATRRQRHPDQ